MACSQAEAGAGRGAGTAAARCSGPAAAVGALLLLGGFFNQRLSSELEERPLG